MSKPPPKLPVTPRSPKKSSLTQAPICSGAMVAARFGPIIAPDTCVRCEIRGVVLKAGESKGQWYIHWFSVGKIALHAFNTVRVISGSNRVMQSHVDQILKGLTHLYVGDVSALLQFVDRRRAAVARISNSSYIPRIPHPPGIEVPITSIPPAKRSKLQLTPKKKKMPNLQVTPDNPVPPNDNRPAATPATPHEGEGEYSCAQFLIP